MARSSQSPPKKQTNCLQISIFRLIILLLLAQPLSMGVRGPFLQLEHLSSCPQNPSALGSKCSQYSGPFAEVAFNLPLNSFLAALTLSLLPKGMALIHAITQACVSKALRDAAEGMLRDASVKIPPEWATPSVSSHRPCSLLSRGISNY